MLSIATKLPMTHIPYKGTGPAVAALVGGQIDIFFATTPPLLGQIRAGKVTPLAVAGSKREKLLPEVPTFVELGYPNIQLTNWFGLFGPKNLPTAVLENITKDVTSALNDPGVIKALEDQSEAIEVAIRNTMGDKGEIVSISGDTLVTWRSSKSSKNRRQKT
jgi:tripartite-type tricarboxylate transporter receptor subunit TctC